MRGRLVVILLAIFIFQFPIFNSVFSSKISAQEKNISVTATVEPSILWKEAITQYSKVTIETQNPEILKPIEISILSKGLLDQIIPNQKIKVELYLNKVLIQEIDLQSNQNGIAGFAFVPKMYGIYLVIAENITYKQPISLNPLSLLIQKNESIFNVIINLFHPKGDQP